MAIPAKLTLFPGNDQIVELDGLIDQTTNQFVNNATVTATLYDVLHRACPNASNIAFVFTLNSNGVYRGQISANFFTASPNFLTQYGGGYLLKIDASNGTSALHLEIPVEVVPRNA